MQEDVSGQPQIGVLTAHAQWPSGVRLRHSVPPLDIRRELGDLVPVWPRGSVVRAAKARHGMGLSPMGATFPFSLLSHLITYMQSGYS